MPRWSAATARYSPRPGPAWWHGHDGGDRRPGAAPAAPGRRDGPADLGPVAAPGAAPQRDAVAPAADRRAVLVRLLPAQHGHAALLGAAHVLEHGAGPHDRRLRPVRGRRGRLDGVARRPPRYR